MKKLQYIDFEIFIFSFGTKVVFSYMTFKVKYLHLIINLNKLQLLLWNRIHVHSYLIFY